MLLTGKAGRIGAIAVQLGEFFERNPRRLMQPIDVLRDNAGHDVITHQTGENFMTPARLGPSIKRVHREFATPRLVLHGWIRQKTRIIDGRVF